MGDIIGSIRICGGRLMVVLGVISPCSTIFAFCLNMGYPGKFFPLAIYLLENTGKCSRAMHS